SYNDPIDKMCHIKAIRDGTCYASTPSLLQWLLLSHPIDKMCHIKAIRDGTCYASTPSLLQ
ncbi:MAG: hypothetical protein ACI9HY_000390, partial [Planctomycetaceae bacterium]